MPTPTQNVLRFHPLFKQTIWGGRRLGTSLNKPIGTASDYAESWEIVDHGVDQSVVSHGQLAGASLSDLAQSHAAWLLGTRNGGPNDRSPGLAFPLLLKYLDCNRVLSVQVHPDDDYGATMPVPDKGKTEAWYIVASLPDSLVYAGLKPGVDRQALADAIQAGETESVLHSFHPQPGDCIFIPAGTVHALGAGLLVAEIQQSSDTTFRLFDWNRMGTDGKPRPLHIRESLDVSDYSSGPVSATRSDRARDGWQDLVRCDKFLLQSLETGSQSLGGDDQFHILTVPRGNATLTCGDETHVILTGESILLPAASPECELCVERDSTVLQMQLNTP
ncbi:type I phosphomannose isomerase catalytic subunit [Stieleria varia]|uniref:Putative mannose-6-phosphate isomerase YvyI n=1 Tax=Stieleria varia TaxID=2528005 RepID=A0A5C6AP96_9BACT|nr:type I phosphomannose isomerase catalytic subunit [Stieleria varia]TWU01328.1 putative mannose-6-phosphate isomerase YvyI [Stieleria varia]